MRDGGFYQGDFVKGEMTGKGMRVWEDGTAYEGDFKEGEKHGHGEITYGSKDKTQQSYYGQWADNIRAGQGTLTMRDGTVFQGTFVRNQPEGDCNIQFNDGSTYKGDVRKSVLHGTGEYLGADGSGYSG